LTSDTWSAATLEGSRPETGAARRVVILAVVFVLACLPVVISPVLPTIDFYDHLNRYFVLANLSGHPFLGENYQSNWSLLPNIGLDVLGTALMGWADPNLVPKIITLFVFLVQYSGVLVFNRVLTGRFSIVTAILCVPLLYSFIFVWGFANFLLGLGLVFWGGAAWLALRRRLPVAVPVGMVIGLVIFLTHGVAFALYGMLLGGLELGFFLLEAEGLTAFLQRLAGLAVQAVVPAALFFVSATAKASGGVTTAGESLHQLAHRGSLAQRLTDLALYRLQTIVRVAEGPTLWFDVTTLAATAALLLWLAARGRVSLPRIIWPPLLIGAILVVIVPPAMFGVGYISDRMPLFFAFMLAGGLVFRVGFDRMDAIPVGLLIALAVVRVAYIGDDWRRYEPDFYAYRAVASQIPPHKVVNFINVSLQPRLGPQRRCEMYGPLLISMYDQAAALFAIPTAQPLRLRGQLAYALSDLPEHRPFKGAEAVDYYRRTLDAVISQKRFDYALICDADLMGRPLPPAAVVAQKGRFTVVRIR
jgi:hypothetical protein